MTEYPCQVANLTVDGAVFLTNQVPGGGLQIVAYIDEIGRVEALSAEPRPAAFASFFRIPAQGASASPRALHGCRQERKSRRESIAAIRASSRPTPNRISRLPDGRVYPCEVIDISLSGAAIKVDVMPSLGTHVMLGKMRGRIVRYLDNRHRDRIPEALDQAQLTDQVA